VITKLISILRNNMKKKITSIGTVPKSNTKIVERGKIDTSISNVQNLLHVHLPEKFGSMRI
jgi:hypothetical protein